MKQFIAAGAFVLLAIFGSVDSFAQMGDPSARAAQMKEKLMTDLKMTNVQADSVVAISMSYMPERKAIFQDSALSMDEKKAKMTTITNEADKRIQPVLGDPLFQQYQAWREKNMQKMMGAKPGGSQ